MSRPWLDLLWSPPIYWGNGFCKHSSNPRSLNANGKRHSCQSLGSELNNVLLETQIPTGKLLRMRGSDVETSASSLVIRQHELTFHSVFALRARLQHLGELSDFFLILNSSKYRNNFEDVYEVSSSGAVVALCWPSFLLLPPHLCFIVADEFATLCGSQRPGFVIDIYTGLPVGESRCHCWNFLVLPLCLRTEIHTHVFSVCFFFFS